MLLVSRDATLDDMSASKEYRNLGMDRPIARRDFLNGIAIGITGASAALSSANANAAQAQIAGTPPTNYPPTRSGLRGNYPLAVDEFDRIRASQYSQFPVFDNDIHE